MQQWKLGSFVATLMMCVDVCDHLARISNAGKICTDASMAICLIPCRHAGRQITLLSLNLVSLGELWQTLANYISLEIGERKVNIVIV